MLTGAIALLLAQPCLPGGDGFLTMRLRGSIDAEVDWREPALDCTGMSRPDGRGLRVRFAGPLPGGGNLAVLFAASDLAMAKDARGVPVNVTLIDDSGERIYGTQGDSRCMLDEVRQQGIADAAYPPRSFRVSASGFCFAPARALDGDGSVLLTRFDFAGRVTYREDEGAAPAELPPHFADLPRGKVVLETASGRHAFDVWIADDDASRERGLMHVTELAPDRGMIFLFERPQPAAFWMKDTPLALDLVFIGPDKTVLNVAHNATPHSLAPIASEGPVVAVLEVVAGTAKRLKIAPGDAVTLPTLPTTSDARILERSDSSR